MKRSKNTLRALMLGSMVAVSLIAPVNVASAASVYDSVIETADSVHLSRDSAIQSSPGCAPLDITSSWETILTNSSSWTSRTQIIGGATKDATLVDWTETQGIEGGYAVVQQHNNNSSYPDSGNSIGDAVYVVFTPSASAQVTFSSNAIYWGAQKQAYMTNSDDA